MKKNIIIILIFITVTFFYYSVNSYRNNIQCCIEYMLQDEGLVGEISNMTFDPDYFIKKTFPEIYLISAKNIFFSKNLYPELNVLLTREI